MAYAGEARLTGGVGDVAGTAPPAAAAAPLGPGAQLARDARLRLCAAGCVVLVHASYQPGHAAYAGLGPAARTAWAAAFGVLVSFPVNAFVLLSFLGLAGRLQAGAPARRLVGAAARRLLPALLFWAVAFLTARALAERRLPSPRAVVEGVLLGGAAAHLYFVPLLLLLTAAAPALGWLARGPIRAMAGAAALALAALGLDHALGPGASRWARMVVGLLGLAPFALAGLALARRWRGVAPGRARAPGVARAALLLALASAGGVALAAARVGGDPTATGLIRWLANLGCALGVPVLLLALPGSVPPRLLRLAPLTLGVYLVHPFFVQALRAAEARLPALAGHPLALVLPNALLAIALSLGAVAAMSRTPFLRRTIL